jgi:hypothetical protein
VLDRLGRIPIACARLLELVQQGHDVRPRQSCNGLLHDLKSDEFAIRACRARTHRHKPEHIPGARDRTRTGKP